MLKIDNLSHDTTHLVLTPFSISMTIQIQISDSQDLFTGRIFLGCCQENLAVMSEDD